MSSLSSRFRIGCALTLFAAVIFAPWWLAFVPAVVLAARWRAWEVIAAGILYDLLWLPAAVSFTSLTSIPLATALALVVVFSLEPLRRRLLI